MAITASVINTLQYAILPGNEVSGPYGHVIREGEVNVHYTSICCLGTYYSKLVKCDIALLEYMRCKLALQDLLYMSVAD